MKLAPIARIASKADIIIEVLFIVVPSFWINSAVSSIVVLVFDFSVLQFNRIFVKRATELAASNAPPPISGTPNGLTWQLHAVYYSQALRLIIGVSGRWRAFKARKCIPFISGTSTHSRKCRDGKPTNLESGVRGAIPSAQHRVALIGVQAKSRPRADGLMEEPVVSNFKMKVFRASDGSIGMHDTGNSHVSSNNVGALRLIFDHSLKKGNA